MNWGHLMRRLPIAFLCLMLAGAGRMTDAREQSDAPDIAILGFSPHLVRGMLIGSGDSRRLKGWVQPSRWDGLDALQRREAADNLAKRMVDQDVDDAEISLIPRNELIITIDHGTVVLVQGGRL